MAETNSGPRGARWGRLTANGPFDVGTDAKPKPQILVEPLSQEQPILSRVELLAPLQKVALPSLAVGKARPDEPAVRASCEGARNRLAGLGVLTKPSKAETQSSSLTPKCTSRPIEESPISSTRSPGPHTGASDCLGNPAELARRRVCCLPRTTEEVR